MLRKNLWNDFVICFPKINTNKGVNTQNRLQLKDSFWLGKAN